MEPLQYFSTTLHNAFGNLLPLFGYALFGYFVCIKLPFYLLLKIKKENTQPEEVKSEVSRAEPIDFRLLQKKVRLEQEAHQGKIHQKADEAKSEKKKEQREEPRQEKKQEKREEKKEEKSSGPEKPKKPQLSLAEEIFDLRPGQVLTKGELKKKYHDLLKKNHPDKVDSLGADFKTLAEKKTKEINQAYQKLKSKAS